MFRRRDPARDLQLSALHDAFGVVASHVDAAQRALLAAIPTSRDPGVSLGQALATFGRRLEQAEAAMEAWRDEGLVHDWTKCTEGLAEARAEAGRLRLEPADLGFEALNARVGDVLHPLDAFADAEAALRRR
jgi:hypothetical protein